MSYKPPFTPESRDGWKTNSGGTRLSCASNIGVIPVLYSGKQDDKNDGEQGHVDKAPFHKSLTQAFLENADN